MTMKFNDPHETPAWRDARFSAEGAAAYVGVSLSTLRRLAKRHSLPSVRVGRQRFFRRQDLDQLMTVS